MSLVLEKSVALSLICLARQAERSIAFGCMSDSQWRLLHEYYSGEKLERLEEAGEWLGKRVIAPGSRISMDEIPHWTFWRVVSYPVRSFVNRFRSRWSVSLREMQFVRQVFQETIEHFKSAAKPDAARLVETRISLSVCGSILRHRLAGLPQLEPADRVEHFCQNYHIVPGIPEEIVGQDIRTVFTETRTAAAVR